METKGWEKPNLEIGSKPINLQGETLLEPAQFRPVGKQYKKIVGKRYRLPRKAKKRFKTNMCKRVWDFKKLKFSYKRLNQDVDGKVK